MEFSTHTYKVELRLNTIDKKEQDEYYTQIRNWRYHCVKAANRIFCHLWVLTNRAEFIYHRILRAYKEEGLNTDLKEVKDKIKQDAAKAETEEYILNPKTGKPIATTTGIYQMLANQYTGLVPSATLSALCNKLVATYTKQKKGYINNQRDLPVFKRDLPIPFTAPSIRNVHLTKIKTKVNRPVKNPKPGEPTHELVERESPAFAFTLYKIPLITNFGRDMSGNFERFKKAFSYHILPDWIKEGEEAFAKEILKNGKASFVMTHEGHELSFFLEDHPYPGKVPKTEDRKYHFVVQSESFEFMMKPTILKKRPWWGIVSDYKLGDSEISLHKKEYTGEDGKLKYKTKIFLHAVIMTPKEDRDLNDKLIAEVKLGTDFPLKIQFRGDVHTIGSYEQLKRKRLDIRAAFSRKQKTPTIGVSGHGRRKRLAVLESYNEKESRYARSQAHFFSKKLIDFLLKNKIKHLHLSPPEAFPDDMPEDVRKEMIRTYGWGDLIQKITYKAKDKGIELKLPKDLIEKAEDL